MRYKIRVYDWNPNGTNDISIVGSSSSSDPRCEDCLDEALFGIDITKIGTRYDDQSALVSLKDCLSHIATSPAESGYRTIKFLQKYFRSLI